MVFNTAHFLVFFLIVVAVYYALPHRYRIGFLLLASCYFYMVAIPVYILVLFALIGIDYAAGLWIAAHQGATRRLMLVVSLLANLGVLGFFKYFNFFSENLAWLAERLGDPAWHPSLHHLALPIGLSFHTFQSMAYTIEVYRGTIPAERNLGRYAIYVLFFPQLVAGPIERPQHMLPQFRARHSFDYARTVSGLRQMLWGMFKKVVVADRMAVLVDTVYAHPADHPGPGLVLATVFYAFQIYCDFSGYSDIALGTARILGFDMMVNFRCPYKAASIGEFWHRWHISLSTWFRDYLYIPLGGSRCALPRRLANLMLTFLVSGLWHGANWTFILWGGLHGAFLSAEVALSRFGLRIPRLLAWPVTFTLVCLAWVFFRAETLEQALFILRRMTLHWDGWWVWLQGASLTISKILPFGGKFYFLDSALVLAILLVTERLAGERPVEVWMADLPRVARWAFMLLLGVAILNLGVAREVPFIYFQF